MKACNIRPETAALRFLRDHDLLRYGRGLEDNALLSIRRSRDDLLFPFCSLSAKPTGYLIP
jgi:hypothetical protein